MTLKLFDLLKKNFFFFFEIIKIEKRSLISFSSFFLVVFNMTSALLNNNIELNLSNGSAFSQFVKSKSVGDVLQKVKPGNNEVVLFDLPVTSTMEQAFDLLLAEDILTIPIYEMEGNKKKYVAIVSALDLLKLLSAKKVAFVLHPWEKWPFA